MPIITLFKAMVTDSILYLGEVFARECPTTMSSPPTIGVNNDLTTGQTCITLWSTGDKSPRRLQMVDGVFIQVMCWDNSLQERNIDQFCHYYNLEHCSRWVVCIFVKKLDWVTANQGTQFLRNPDQKRINFHNLLNKMSTPLYIDDLFS